jgi:hypothetical protein
VATPPSIPFAKLGIPASMESRLSPDAPKKALLAMAKGLLPMAPDVQLAVLYVLATMDSEKLRKAAVRTLRKLPARMLSDTLSMKTHPKVIEFIAEFREPEDALDERMAMLRAANDRTVARIAARANPTLCETLSRNHERLLMSPEVFVALYGNPECSDANIARAESFLRMQGALPDIPPRRPFLPPEDAAEPAESSLEAAAPAAAPEPSAPPAAPAASPVDAPEPASPAMDLEAEIEAALRGERSPLLVAAQEQSLAMFDLDSIQHGEGFSDGGLEGFSFDFSDASDNFSFDLTGNLDSKSFDERNEIAQSIDAKIRSMSVGQKIKLAYLGNKEVRNKLIRDRNKVVAGAVVKSGRLSDQEVAAFAGNKNLDSEVIREIAANREWVRKYPVKVALINNPKTPVAQAVSMVSQMQKKDLLQLTRNRNVPSVITQAAVRLYKKKYQRG